jgi:uncharacterized protein with NRDE domain
MLQLMCLIALAWQAHPRYSLVLAANRDEFHHRPTAAAGYWPDAPGVFGGRDLSQQGSWLALAHGGRIAAVTNVRRMVPPNPHTPTRGMLVADFVRGSMSARDYAAQVHGGAALFAGFNLLVIDGETALYMTNQPLFRVELLRPGVHALSNASLNTPWPKLRRVRDGLSTWAARERDDPEPLFTLLADDRPAADDELPDTGVGLEMERFLSPPFIRGAHYGTRCSTVLAAQDATLRFRERRFGADGVLQGETDQTLPLAPPASSRD